MMSTEAMVVVVVVTCFGSLQLCCWGVVSWLQGTLMLLLLLLPPSCCACLPGDEMGGRAPVHSPCWKVLGQQALCARGSPRVCVVLLTGAPTRSGLVVLLHNWLHDCLHDQLHSGLHNWLQHARGSTGM
jgi:hypothetical protein